MRAARALPTDLLTSRRADRLIADEVEALAEKYAQPGALEDVIEGIPDPAERLAFLTTLREAPNPLATVRAINARHTANRRSRRRMLSRQQQAAG